jgi:peptide/nickel transport system substrate-binding protein
LQPYSLSWVRLEMPDIFCYIFHSTPLPQAGANRGPFASFVADALLERPEASDSRAEQIALYREDQARLLESLPYVPLGCEANVLVTRPDFRGYPLALDGSFDGLLTVARRGEG